MNHKSGNDLDKSDKSVTVLRRTVATTLHTPDIAKYVSVVDGSALGKKIELGLNPITVGRQNDNHLVLSDPFVSSHHCSIMFRDGAVWVADLASTNGTFIDGKRVNGKVAWPESTSLQIGNQVLRHEYRVREEIARSAQLADDLLQAAAYVRSLLPPPIREGTIRVDWHAQPSAALGGDIFNYYWLDNEHFLFYLIDVCGHGVGAALHSVSVANLIRQRFLPATDFSRPAEVLQALNRAFPMETHGSMYFTTWYGVYQVTNRRLVYASAGHPPAVLFGQSNGDWEVLSTKNPPIGMLEDAIFAEAVTQLPPHCTLYIFSDGAFEITTKSGDWWSHEAFAQFLNGRLGVGAGKPNEIFQSVLTVTRGNRFDDDFTLLQLEFPTG